jgi:hypothetical protein
LHHCPHLTLLPLRAFLLTAPTPEPGSLESPSQSIRSVSIESILEAT